MKPVNYYIKSLRLLERLQKNYPLYNLGKHFSIAFQEYGDLFTLTDKVFYNALNNYVIELEQDVPHSEEEIDKIINDGLHLDNILEEEEE